MGNRQSERIAGNFRDGLPIIPSAHKLKNYTLFTSHHALMTRFRNLHTGQVALLWIVGLALLGSGLMRVPERMVSPEIREEYATFGIVSEKQMLSIRQKIAEEPRRQDSLMALRDSLKTELTQLTDPEICAKRDPFDGIYPANPFLDIIEDDSTHKCAPTFATLENIKRVEKDLTPLSVGYLALQTVDNARSQSRWLRVGGLVGLVLALVVTWLWFGSRTQAATTSMLDPSAAPGIERPSPLIVRAVAVITSLVILYYNSLYLYLVWNDTLAQGGRLWLMVTSFIVLPPIWLLSFYGAAYPTLALWKRPETLLRGVLTWVLAVLIGFAAELPVLLWSFVMLTLGKGLPS